MKRFSAVALAIILVFALAACGEAAKEGTSMPAATQAKQSETTVQNVSPTATAASAWLSTRTGRFYSQFSGKMYMEYEMEVEGSVMTVISATSGEKAYAETKADGVSSVTISDGEYMYMIEHTSKTVIKNPAQSGTKETVNTMISENDVVPANVKTGTRDIDGKTYDTEQWSVDGAFTILCFDGEKLAYMISEYEGKQTVIKVLKTDSNVDNSLFELPKDYQVVSY